MRRERGGGGGSSCGMKKKGGHRFREEEGGGKLKGRNRIPGEGKRRGGKICHSFICGGVGRSY